ncbi:hypothetical protein DUT91_07910 [Phyllobacterium salinisoli]|uniref:Uncharacterized protein n=1 Tax=Phyllobacterium salinisoli TaxID=1899321 RepID=A0A368K4W7_9HYPH|nr:hypothetical protein DUT91_07910 [Phyllobacterium salinisoli]
MRRKGSPLNTGFAHSMRCYTGEVDLFNDCVVAGEEGHRAPFGRGAALRFQAIGFLPQDCCAAKEGEATLLSLRSLDFADSGAITK